MDGLGGQLQVRCGKNEDVRIERREQEGSSDLVLLAGGGGEVYSIGILGQTCLPEVHKAG